MPLCKKAERLGSAFTNADRDLDLFERNASDEAKSFDKSVLSVFALMSEVSGAPDGCCSFFTDH